jgi:hypothetical protein
MGCAKAVLRCACYRTSKHTCSTVLSEVPQPGTGVGEMVEGKIVGKNENNIRLVISS